MALEPWGEIPQEREKQAKLSPMKDWRINIENDDPKKREAAWEKFFNQRVADLSNNLWPEYDRETFEWTGDASKNACSATRLELEICNQSFWKPKVIEQYPNTPLFKASAHSMQNHLWHYKVEDFIGYWDSRPGTDFEKQASGFPSENLVFYDPEYLNSKKYWMSLKERFIDLSGKKAAGTFGFKEKFLRPRPYTASVVLGVPSFKFHTANKHIHTGMHPSFPSGHCLQGLLFSAGIAEQEAGGDFSEERAEALSQFAVDFGDRRVFAGVHYPTDNIASWVNAVKLAPHIYKDGDAAKAFIVNAIKTKSLVYKVIQKEFPNQTALQPKLDYLNKHI